MAASNTEEIELPALPSLPARTGESRRALLALPADTSEPAAGVLVVPDSTGVDDALRASLGELSAAGFAALAPLAPAWLADRSADAGAEWEAFRKRSDRAEVAALESALAALAERPEVDGDRLAVVGLGTGGTLAFLLGCTSTRVGAVVDVGGRIVYPELSAEKPVQPLELALNLGSPVLAIFAEEDPATPAADRDALRERLAQFAVRCEVELCPGVGHGYSNPSRGGYHEASARHAWKCILRFLSDELARP